MLCYMLFKPKNKEICDSAIKICIGNHEIKRVNSTKFLGVQIDANLIWKEHVDDICTKISRTIDVLNSLKETIPRRILLTLYNTMILPYISYCNIIWGSCALYLLNRTFVLQRRAMRIINNVSPLSNTDLLYQKFKILSVADINKLQVAVFMYSYHLNLLPLSFKNLFNFNYAIDNHKTRISKSLHLPLFKYNLSRTTVKFTGAKHWNEMPNKIKNSKTLNQFRRVYKDYLLKIENNNVNKSCLPVFRPFFLVPFIVYVLMCFLLFLMCMINKIQYLYIWGLAIDRLHILCRFLHILISLLFCVYVYLLFA